MPVGSSKAPNTAQKLKVLTRLFDADIMTEKDLKALDLGNVLKISGITISDMKIITDLKDQTAKGRLFSYLAGAPEEAVKEPKDWFM